MGGLWHCFTHRTMGVPEPEKTSGMILGAHTQESPDWEVFPVEGNPRAQFAAWIVPQNQHVYESKQNQTNICGIKT